MNKFAFVFLFLFSLTSINILSSKEVRPYNIKVEVNPEFSKSSKKKYSVRNPSAAGDLKEITQTVKLNINIKNIDSRNIPSLVIEYDLYGKIIKYGEEIDHLLVKSGMIEYNKALKRFDSIELSTEQAEFIYKTVIGSNPNHNFSKRRKFKKGQKYKGYLIRIYVGEIFQKEIKHPTSLRP